MERERWSSRIAFVLSTIGSAVGLGNVWRFPFVAYRNGGGAFLIPYFVALFVAGIPLLMMETAIGQKFQGSAAKTFSMISKKWEWLGWFAIFVGTVICSYYAVVLSWALNYLFFSFNLSWNISGSVNFFFNDFLKVSSTPFDFSSFNLNIFIGLVVVWLITGFIIIKGIKTLGKFNTFLLPLSFLILFVLLLRGITLKGSLSGVERFFTPDFKKLLSLNVWIEAFSQIFYTLSLGFGILIAYASYRDEKTDIANNAKITGFTNSLVEFIAGITVFSTVGFLAFSNNVSIDSLRLGGPGLAFVTYPEAIAKIPAFPNLFGILFFSMLLFLGLTSLVSLIEAVVTGLKDRFNFSRKKSVFIIVGVDLLFGLLYCFGSGILWLDIVDHWILTYGLLVVGLFETVIVAWFFGSDRLRSFINSVSEINVDKIFEVSIKYIVPLFLVVLLSYSIFSEFRKPYEGYPLTARIFGGFFVVFLTLLISIFVSNGKNWKDVSNSGKIYLMFLFVISVIYVLYEKNKGINWGALFFFLIGFAILAGNISYSIYVAIKNERKKSLKDEIPPTTF
ncbi:MAG: sodium-dependent transporter [candidate division WOR-3 bacterium]